MRRQTCGWPGRRGTALVASAAVLCLGGALAGCGGPTGGDGYTAVGAAGAGPGRTPSGAPSGKVTLVPLDGAGDGGRSGASPSPGRSSGPFAEAGGADSGTGASGGAGGDAARPGASGGPVPGSGSSAGATSNSPPPSGAGTTGGSGSAGGSGTTGGSGSVGGSGTTGGSGATGGSTGPASPSAPGSPAPGGAPVLVVAAPVRAAADERWCEKVTVEFRNTGGSPARSGTVTFATHIIGGLGVDWATRESTAPLPVPIGAGAARKMTYTVCVDAWRVPLGMHVETRDVTAVWK
ncbi:hypothetical protein ABZ454_02435 [Streptomyces sp. NPDC005803]|uniref:hypothetical protein n=1 Tax=Streptomyces sp. NPDC005803 TaxID=3154297 RepID=UPI0034104552